jgi:hypothetical protein
MKRRLSAFWTIPLALFILGLASFQVRCVAQSAIQVDAAGVPVTAGGFVKRSDLTVDQTTKRLRVDVGTTAITGTVTTSTNMNISSLNGTAISAANPLPTTNALTQSRTYSTNIVLASASTPVVLGTTQTFQWLTIVGNSLGRVANTNTIYLQTQADNGTNGIPVAAGGTVTLSMPANKYDYLSNYWVGGVVGGAKVFWGY